MTLTEFLHARITEDEALMNRDCKGTDCYVCPNHEGLDTIRMEAECEAKRRIIRERDDEHSWPIVLQHLAVIYADHPDYREEWKP